MEIISITRGSTVRGCKVALEDGSSFFVPSGLLDRYLLTPGMELSENEIFNLKTEGEYLLAGQRAADLLSRRDHSCSELRLKLIRKGYSKEAVERVIVRFREKNYLDDERFASAWIESRLKRHPEGRSVLAAGLAAKGVSRQIIHETLDLHLSEEILDEAFSRASQKLLRKSNITKEKYIRSMVRFGFSFSQVSSSANELFS